MLWLLPATPLCLVCRIIYSPRFLGEASRCGVGGVILVQVVGCGDGFRLPSCGQALVAVLFSGWGRVKLELVMISFARIYGFLFKRTLVTTRICSTDSNGHLASFPFMLIQQTRGTS